MKVSIKLKDFLNNVKDGLAEFGEELVARGKLIEEERSRSADEKAELEHQLDDIEAAYQNSPYRTYGSNKLANIGQLTYDAPTDEDIEQTAQLALAEEKAQKEGQLRSSTENKIKSYEKNKSDVAEQADKSVNKLAESAETAKVDAENQALKRGLGRSSIVTEQLNDIDKANIEASGQIYSAAQSAIADFDEKISALESELSDALDKLDVDTAVKTNEKIKQLKAERDDKVASVTKYNNDLLSQRAQELNKLAKQGIDTSETSSEEYLDKTREKMKLLYGYYYSMGDSARKEIEKDKDFISGHIGTSGYDYLRNLLS